MLSTNINCFNSLNHGEVIMCKKVLYYFILLQMLCLFAFGCTKKNTEEIPLEDWVKVEDFFNESILALAVNSDSTELQVVTSNLYGNLQNTSENFSVRTLQYPIHVDGYGRCKFLPYIKNNLLFYCSDDGQIMHIYKIGNSSFQLIKDLSIYDFISDSTGTEFFTRSHWRSLSNHIIDAGENYYYISTSRELNVNVIHYGQHLIYVTNNDNFEYQTIYSTIPLKSFTVFTETYSTHLINDLFFQSVYIDPTSVVVLNKTSPINIDINESIYPFMNLLDFQGSIYGFGDGVIIKSSDNGFNWDLYAYMNAAWFPVKINSKNVFYIDNNIGADVSGSFLLGDKIIMLDTTILTWLKINYLLEFNGYVYAGTNEGLYKRSLKTFFTPRKTNSKNGVEIIIRRK